ncbi:hypothetical protein MHZ93_24265 [Roseomonas sp. ACRSG]|nr:hypothetical protein [Roseomonas sp. ACRSG]
MAKAVRRAGQLNVADMRIIEHVLNMGGGYVLDLHNHEFDDLIAHEVGVDAQAPHYSEDGDSKAKRFRRILHSLAPDLQAKLLHALLQYRDSISGNDKIARSERVDLLGDRVRLSYEAIIKRLELLAAENKQVSSSSWTGRRTLGEQIQVVRSLTPLALAEIDALANLVEAHRFNDPVTADAVKCLRELHTQLGELLAAVDGGGSLTIAAVAAIEANRSKLIGYLQEGAKVAVVAPAMTLGVVHILAALSGITADSTMFSSVYAAILGAGVLKSIGKKTSLASGQQATS